MFRKFPGALFNLIWQGHLRRGSSRPAFSHSAPCFAEVARRAMIFVQMDKTPIAFVLLSRFLRSLARFGLARAPWISYDKY